jgi:glutamine amidotransferase-like uncharacterized protein
MTNRAVNVYAGKGSSHSWTWLADLFESASRYDVRFLDSRGFSESLRDASAAAIVSGGDGFAIASAIGATGFSRLKGYIHSGGTYVGICAGAYLPLHSSLDPFSKFNISSTRIENIDTSPSPERTSSPRFGVSYGSCAICHPVRGEVIVSIGEEALEAPIYGGPIFREPSRDEVVARYSGVTARSEFQIQRDLAVRMIEGKPAIIRARHGDGQLLLLGPHLEHPRFSHANAKFLSMLGIQHGPRANMSSKTKNLGLARAVADLKVATLGLENRSFLVGNKLWDGGRFLELVRAIERRLSTADGPLGDEVASRLMRVREEILEAESGSLLFADEGPERLVEATRLVVDNHFVVLRESRNR